MPEIKKIKRTTYRIYQIGINLFLFNENYRQIRGGAKYKGFSCFSCNRKFEDGEDISLAVTNKGNKTLCIKCAVKFKKELGDSEWM